jgi:hypothetical protein
MADDFEVSQANNANQMYVSIWNSATNASPNIPFALIVAC